MEIITLNINVAETPPLNIMGYSDGLGLHKCMFGVCLCIFTEGLAIAVVFVIVIVLTSPYFVISWLTLGLQLLLSDVCDQQTNK